jgi:hypothetical protein
MNGPAEKTDAEDPERQIELQGLRNTGAVPFLLSKLHVHSAFAFFRQSLSLFVNPSHCYLECIVLPSQLYNHDTST